MINLLKIEMDREEEQLTSKTASYEAAIIVAGGSSQRFGENKLRSLIQGRPLISYSVETFAAISWIKEVILVVASGQEASFAELLNEIKIIDRKVKIIHGGKSRYESVQRGLLALSSNIKWVAIHDGARPLVSPAMIELTFQKARENGAAALAVPLTETIHRASPERFAEVTIDRSNLWSMQTPQVFRKADLMMLPEGNKNFTDEVSALLEHGKKVYLVENGEPNIKVTYPRDLDLVNAIVQMSD